MSRTNQQTVDTYDKTVARYIKTSPQAVNGQLKDWIDKNLAVLNTTAKILEIGSGSGKDADYFETKGFKMEMTDASQGFVKYLLARGKKARVLNALTDELGTNYDMVFADAVFLHFTRHETEKVINKIYKTLKKGGRLVFSLKAGDGEELTNRKLDANRYFCFWQPERIKVVLGQAGFTSISIDVIDDYRGKVRPDWLLISAVK